MNELQEKAQLLKADKNYEEAAKLYKELYDKNGDKWDGWGLAFCLNKLKKYKEALVLSEKIYQEDDNFEYIKSTYAWSLYMEKINQSSSGFDSNNIQKNLNIILDLEQDRKFWSGKALIATLDHFSKNNGWETVYEIGKKNDPIILDDRSREWEGRTISSDREKWYLKTTKACAQLGKWTDCMEISKKGLEDFPDVIWLKRSYALSMGYSGYSEKAIKLLKDLLIQKQDWFMYRDIARIYRKDSNLLEEKNYLIQGCFVSKNIPDPKFRWEMYYDLGCNLIASNELEYGKLHIQLALAVRTEEGWPIPDNLQSIINKYAIEDQFEKTGKQFIKELSFYWKKEKPNPYSGQVKKNGEIKAILPNGKSGFITSLDGDYFFRFDKLNFNKSQVKLGLSVSFYTEKTFDKKKDKESLMAVDISI